MRPTWQTRATRWLLALAFWTLLALFFASQTGMTYTYAQGTAPWPFIIKLSLSEWYIWAALSPLVVWLARRFPFERGRRLRALLVHLPSSLLLVTAKVIIEDAIRRNLFGLGEMNPINKVHFSFLTYWAIVGVTHAFAYYRRYREQQLTASQLETQLAHAQLQALQMQLQPHFLFNTLHAISTLMHRDVEAADRMLARLSELLRLALDHAGVQQVPLRQELEFLAKYLEIEQTRFQDRLTVQMEIQPATLDAQVPNLILQPLVENAVRHGIAPRAEPGRIEIRAAVRDAALQIEIVNSGGPADPFTEGVGLRNTRQRLEKLYGSKQRFVLVAQGHETHAKISIPLRVAPRGAAQ